MDKEYFQKFNKTFSHFISFLIQEYPEQEIVTGVYLQDYSDKLVDIMKEYYDNIQKIGLEFSNKNEIIFSDDVIILDNIHLASFWKLKLSDSQKIELWKYLHILYLYAECHYHNKTINSYIKLYKKEIKKKTSKLQDNEKIILGVIDNIYRSNQKQLVSKPDTVKEEANGDTLNNLLNNDLLKNNLLKNNLLNKDLLNGEIGKLANDIIGEIDVNMFKDEEPGKLMQNLLQGNIDKDSPIIKLVDNISHKISDKFESADFDGDKLINEAESFVKTLAPNLEMFKNIANIIPNESGVSRPKPKQNTHSKMLKQKLKKRKNRINKLNKQK